MSEYASVTGTEPKKNNKGRGYFRIRLASLRARKDSKGALTMAAAKSSFGTANLPLAQGAPTRRLIGPKDLPGKGVCFNSNHLRRLWKRGEFPPPVYLSERRFAWPEEEIDKWIADKIAASAKKRSSAA